MSEMSVPHVSFVIESLFIGQVKLFVQWPEGDELNSAFMKKFVDGEVKLTKDGIEGDARGAPTHQGRERALYFYPKENYDKLKLLLPEMNPEVFVPGAVGENISLSGFSESDICLGDIFEVGTAVVQITSPRRPCFKLNHRFQYEKMSHTIQSNALTGWMALVLTEGYLKIGSRVTLKQRILPKMTVASILRIYNDPNMERSELQELYDCEMLEKRWKEPVKFRLEEGKIPEDLGRLFGGKLKFSKDAAIKIYNNRENN